MSLTFNDTTNYRGLVQIYEKELGFNIGDVSGNTTRLKEFTADCNLALDEFFHLAIQASATWQIDDSNQTDYPIIYIDLVSGQRDYAFVTDGSGNLILDIFRVLVAGSDGVFSEISPVDQQTKDGSNSQTVAYLDARDATGTPTTYDKTANGLFLNPIPNYSLAAGLKVLINREGSYFVYTDTTKKPGVPGLYHKYFALKPAQDYARRNSLACLPRLEVAVAQMEEMIKENFANRERDVKKRLQANIESSK